MRGKEKQSSFVEGGVKFCVNVRFIGIGEKTIVSSWSVFSF